MSKAELKLLEKAFEAEIESAVSESPRVMQTKSKLALKLVDDGMLQHVTIKLGGRFPMRIDGYELTHVGRMAYCESCK